jgi:hypothetical protein
MEEITPAPISELPLILSPHHGGDPPAPRLPSTSPGEHKASHLIPISRSKESEQDEIYVNSELTFNIEKCVPLQVSVTGTDQPSFKPDGSGQISNRVSGEELAAQKISSSSEKHISLEDVDRSVHSNQHTSADDKPVEETIRPLGEITSVPISESHSSFFAHQGEDPLLVQQLSSTSSGKRKICDFNQGSSSKRPKQDDIARKNDPTLKSDKRAFLQISAMGITQSHLKSKGIIRDKKPPTKFANFELPPEIQRNKQGAKRETHAPVREKPSHEMVVLALPVQTGFKPSQPKPAADSASTSAPSLDANRKQPRYKSLNKIVQAAKMNEQNKSKAK